MSHTPYQIGVPEALDKLLAQHEGKPSAVVEMLDVAIDFVQRQSSPSSDAGQQSDFIGLRQAIVTDLNTVRDFFQAL